MNKSVIRWHQRLNGFDKALAQLNKACLLGKERDLSELEQQGLIQSFEFTHELAWNVMKDFFFSQGRVIFMVAGMQRERDSRLV